MATNLTTSRRVLIVRIGALGDVLHALPAVSALHCTHPQWEIDWAVDPRWAPLLPAGSVVHHIHLVPTQSWKARPLSGETLREITALRRTMRAQRYDLCIDLQGTIRSAVVGWLAGAKRFIGPAEPRERLARIFYGEKVRTHAAHVVEQACEIVSAAICERLEPGAVALPADAAAEAWCDAALRRLNVVSEYALIVPRAGWGAKQWPAARFGEVAAALAQRGVRVLISASDEKDALAAEVANASGDLAQVVVCSLTELVALERRAALVIAGDTGPLHLAAALRRPVVGLYGPTDPLRNGPYGASRSHIGALQVAARVLRHPSSVTDHSRHAAGEAGLRQISSDVVTASAMDLLEATRRGRSTP